VHIARVIAMPVNAEYLTVFSSLRFVI